MQIKLIVYHWQNYMDNVSNSIWTIFQLCDEIGSAKCWKLEKSTLSEFDPVSKLWSYFILHNVIFANKPSIFNIVFLTQHICYWLSYVLFVSLSFFSPNMYLRQKDPYSFAQHGQRFPPSFNVAQCVYENWKTLFERRPKSHPWRYF